MIVRAEHKKLQQTFQGSFFFKMFDAKRIYLSQFAFLTFKN